MKTRTSLLPVSESETALSDNGSQKAAHRKRAKKRQKGAATRTQKPARARKGPKGGDWTFPKHTLDEAIKIAQAIEETNGGNPLEASQLVKPVGFRSASDWRFLERLRAANQYGIVEGSGQKAVVAITKLGNDIMAPDSASQRQQALLAAFHNVELFKRVADYYGGKPLPAEEYFGNTLVRAFGVPKDRVSTFISVFTGNLEYIKAFRSTAGEPRVVASLTPDINHRSDSAPPSNAAEEPREFLDTCFVLMPFGEWFDKYYKEVYVAAIKDAAFEPMRADDLFKSGMVMEQIWEQIRKAKVLMAELTGRNANVFYELGLAHALPKPVVIVTANLDDVPFDLRHLRVITYDQREPRWGDRLKTEISSNLKNAKSDPESCIPPTFRTGELTEA